MNMLDNERNFSKQIGEAKTLRFLNQEDIRRAGDFLDKNEHKISIIRGVRNGAIIGLAGSVTLVLTKDLATAAAATAGIAALEITSKLPVAIVIKGVKLLTKETLNNLSDVEARIVELEQKSQSSITKRLGETLGKLSAVLGRVEQKDTEALLQRQKEDKRRAKLLEMSQVYDEAIENAMRGTENYPHSKLQGVSDGQYLAETKAAMRETGMSENEVLTELHTIYSILVVAMGDKFSRAIKPLAVNTRDSLKAQLDAIND